MPEYITVTSHSGGELHAPAEPIIIGQRREPSRRGSRQIIRGGQYLVAFDDQVQDHWRLQVVELGVR